MRILVAEPSEDVADVIALVLRGSGHECCLVSDGRDAWSRVESEQWDVMVISPDLPGVATRHLVRLAKRDSDSRMRIVWLEEAADERSRIAAYRVGADCIVGRPFAPEELLAAVEAPLYARPDRA